MINLNEQNKKWVDDIFAKLEKKLLKTALSQREQIPYTTMEKKYVPDTSEGIVWWTNGFFGGLMWLMYNATGNEEFKTTAEIQEKLLDEAFKNFEGLHHDVGFMWGLTAKTNYRLTGNETSRLRAIYAANILSARYNAMGNFIRSWNGDGKVFSIIDSMLNIPLLYWAANELSDDRFKYIALKHADMTKKEHIREDGSVVHICVHNEIEDKVEKTLAGQGYCEGSAWSRGQSWAVYGFILSYIHTKNEEYLETARKTADYFMEGVKQNNYKTPTDFKAPKEPVYYDNTAGAITACGMIEIYKACGEEKYLNTAINILKAMEEDCIFDDSDESILQNCMSAYYIGKQVHLIYGDFYFTEAILKLKNSDFLIW